MEREKHIDESWKESAKQEPQGETCGCGHDHCHDHGEEQAVEINFMNYVTSLGFQALIFMGEIPNPITNETDKNLIQAKFIIDTLTMIKDKTKGNLSDQENNLLESSLAELQLRYVDVIKAEAAQAKKEGK
jgi:hypothetical protein